MSVVEYRACYDNDEVVALWPDEVDSCARFGVKMRQYSLAHGHKDRGGYGHRPPDTPATFQSS